METGDRPCGGGGGGLAFPDFCGNDGGRGAEPDSMAGVVVVARLLERIPNTAKVVVVRPT